MKNVSHYSKNSSYVTFNPFDSLMSNSMIKKKEHKKFVQREKMCIK